MMAQKNFALIGVAGYIAPRHVKAIAETGNILLAAHDLFDSVGYLDSYFPECRFFTDTGAFSRFCADRMGTDSRVHYTSVCTPNHTHDAFIRYGLRLGTDVICEKPLVLNPDSIDDLMELEKATGHKAYTILQLRLHDSVRALKKMIDESPADKIHDVDLTYITPRGRWYYASWKGDMHKSGGIATNIGVHLYDMLLWIFGPVNRNIVHLMSFDRVAGYMEFEKARVRYFLSINADSLPESALRAGKKTYRTMIIDGTEFEFSSGFTELHTLSYRKILNGEGFRIGDARQSIQIVSNIRHATPTGVKGDYHPLARLSSGRGM